MDRKVVLYQNWYLDFNKNRQQELDECLRKNIDCKLISKIVLLGKRDDLLYINNNFKNIEFITLLEHGTRPTYNNFFDEMGDSRINILANSDIYFTDSLKYVHEIREGECFALSRWDKKTDGTIVPFCHIDTQDVWVFAERPRTISGADFTLGMPGCDNKIAYLLKRNEYKVYNPSIDIKCIHIHMTEKRNYNRTTDTIQPPYAMVLPITMKQIQEYASQS